MPWRATRSSASTRAVEPSCAPIEPVNSPTTASCRRPERQVDGEGRLMAKVRVLSWRGIPAQVKARDESGKRVGQELPGWFTQEIDRVAMREGIIGSDEYLAEWTWGEDQERPGTAEEAATAM